MPASCPFCGTTLNFGLKFCVVCGRHTTSAEMTKLGGLKTGIKQAENTRRLDESISSSDFETSRKKPLGLARQIKSMGEHLFYVLIGVTLFFCAVRFTLQTYFPGKVHQLLSPILGRNSGAIEQTLTGTSAPPSDEEEDDVPEKPKKEEVKKVQAKKPAVVTTTKKTTRTRKRGRHRSRRHAQQKTHST